MVQWRPKSWNKFVKRVKTRKCLEVGSGPFGFLAPCYWIRDRVIVDPLIDDYRSFQVSNFGNTLFTDDIVTYSQPGEKLIDELVGNVDGFIVCRNAIDHCENPMAVLSNFSKYASKGCYLLLWTDIWHLSGIDEGHRNITRSVEELDTFMTSIGFSIVRHCSKIRNPEHFIEYGRLFIKL